MKIWINAKRYRESLVALVVEHTGRQPSVFDRVFSGAGASVLLSSKGKELDLEEDINIEVLKAFLDLCDENEDVAVVSLKDPLVSLSFRLDTPREEARREHQVVWSRRSQLVKDFSDEDARKKIRQAGMSCFDFFLAKKRKKPDLSDLLKLVIAIEDEHYCVREIQLPPPNWEALKAESRGWCYFEGGDEHKDLCASVVRWFSGEGWGWGTIADYAGGRCDVVTKRRCPRLYAECGNLSTGIDKLVSAVDAAQAVLYAPFENDAKAWLIEPTTQTYENETQRLWRKYAATRENPQLEECEQKK